MIEAVTSVNQSIIVYPINFAQYFWLLVVGIIILSRHPKMMGSVGFFYNILSKPIGYIWLGLFFLLLGGFFIFFNFGVTEQIAILAYFSFAVGVVFQFIKVVVTKHEY